MVAKDLLFAADRDLDGFINFSEYLLIRKAIIAWKQCASYKMNRSGLKCALTIVQPYKAPEQNEADMMWDLIVDNNNAGTDKMSLSFQLFVLIADM